METQKVKVDANDLKQLIQDVQLLKNVLLSEGELTDWAKQELDNARALPDLEYVSLEEVEKRILAK